MTERDYLRIKALIDARITEHMGTLNQWPIQCATCHDRAKREVAELRTLKDRLRDARTEAA